MSELRFKCSTCGKWHEGLPDVFYQEPDYSRAIAGEERKQRIYLTSDLCVIDNTDFFIRCLLLIPIHDTDHKFGWGIWSSLSRDNFVRYQKHYDDDISDWPPMFGYLSNKMRGYPDTLSLKLSVQGMAKGQRPELTLEPTDHPLSIDQQNGIAFERAVELAMPSLHP